MKIPFLGGSSQVRSRLADQQRALNVFIEMSQDTPRAPAVMYGRPGMSLLFTLDRAPVRHSIRQGDYAFFVSGNGVYRVDGAWTATLLGTIATAEGRVGMASNGVEVLIVDGVGGWLATAETLTEITDPDFPNGVTQCSCLDGYFVATGDGTEKFYINETPRLGAVWSGLDFASAEGSPDNTVTCVTDHNQLWLVGNASGEVWSVSGNPDFPIEPAGNTYIPSGTAAANSVQYMDNTVFWLNADENGAGMVCRAEGYTPRRVSSHAMEKAIQGYGRIDDAFAFCFQMEGHSFYVLTFPTADHTWVYDAASSLWFEWLWRNPQQNTLHRWRASCHVYLNETHLVGDHETGKVYALSLDTYSDNGDPMLRLRATAATADTSRRQGWQFYSDLVIDAETGSELATGQGSAPIMMMRYWDEEGGWTSIDTAPMGGPGQHASMVRFPGSLGRGKDRVWEISVTDPVKFAVFGATVDVEAS